jgi:hypothetical protein
VPVVVDAFFAALRTNPADLGLSPSANRAVV